ncbi:MAG TPA: AcvB/VirJ family lysyl-phosphatidylglycerol hydrolase [Steroidobacteraceae bacterium]|jgi:type IV secretory pathway VirJ component|nr:AcvB/VirJ family lysyl-phosphatidylglycerol hydrolase [Steroidobacteraceae bacterium]
MKRWWWLLLLWGAQCGAETLSHGRFENLAIYRPGGEVQRVVLFLSGDQGWSEQLSRSAQLLASQGALVAGIDSRALFANLERDGAECVYPDGDLENLSHFLQAYYRLPSYEPSVLVGYGAGGTMSYAMLAQAPAETFAGGVSIDFCPELRLRKRLCETNSLHTVPIGKKSSHSLLVRDKLDAQWIVFQSPTQRVCHPAVTQKFVSEAPGAELQPVSMDPKTGNWEAALSVAVQRLDPPPKKRSAALPADLAGLPIVEVPTKHAGSTLAIFISGDGGWAGIDKAVAASLVEKGIAVVGVDSLRYFWKERTPQSAAADVDRIAQHYLDAWDKKEVLLIGYSQGADILPFVVNRLPAATRDHVRLVAMLGLGVRAVFEFHLANWLSQGDDGLPIAPELQRMSKVRALCLYNEDGDESACPDAASSTLRAVNLPGGHHFGGDYDHVAALILEQMR